MSFLLQFFTEISAVYDRGLNLSLLGALSLISTASHFWSLITTHIQNSSKILSFEENKFFRLFHRKMSIGHPSNFVERVKIYHNLKVHDKRTCLQWVQWLARKMRKVDKKKVSLISSPSHFLSLISTRQLFLVPNYDTREFPFFAYFKHFLVPIFVTKHFLVANFVTSFKNSPGIAFRHIKFSSIQ